MKKRGGLSWREPSEKKEKSKKNKGFLIVPGEEEFSLPDEDDKELGFYLPFATIFHAIISIGKNGECLSFLNGVRNPTGTNPFFSMRNPLKEKKKREKETSIAIATGEERQRTILVLQEYELFQEKKSNTAFPSFF